MTERDASPSVAADALAAYLVRVDMQLARAGLACDERDAVCRQLVEQFCDLLPTGPDEATAEQVDEALAKLSNEADFGNDDVRSLGRSARGAWHRFWVGEPMPLVLNDAGRRRVLWGVLIGRLVRVFLLTAVASLLAAVILVGRPTAGWFVYVVGAALALPAMVAVMVLRMPVETLPRAEHWPPERRARSRGVDSLILVGSFLFAIGLFPMAYAAVALLLGRSVWPIDRPVFFTVMVTLAGLFLLASYAEALRRRRRRLQFRQWATGVPPA